ncbi:MAG: AMP-binding protein [Acidimicrobiia bacterium]
MSRIARAPDFLANATARWPERIAVHFRHDALTFAQLDARADELAGALAAAGVGPGDRFALLSPNHPVHLTAQVAACRLGAALVPLNTRLAVAELDHIVGDAGPRVLLAHESTAAAAAEVAAGHPDLAAWTFPADDPLGPPGPDRDRRPLGPSEGIDPEAVATILYTSGTTGRPKGAMISNRALAARMTSYVLDPGMRRGCTFLQPLPMFHIAATVSFAASSVGGTNVILESFSAAAVEEAVARHGVTHALLVPTMIKDVVAGCDPARFTTLETVLYGASSIEPEDLRRAMQVLGCSFWQSFGQTETGPVTSLVAEDHDADDPVRLTAAGRVGLGCEIAVVDGEDRPLPPGEVGEIVARGPAMMSGYWGLPEASAEAMRGGWLHTGDLGRFDADRFLHVTDRLKDMVVSGGENVYPREVERVLLDHPAVADVAVVGVPHPRWGEAVHAVVVPADPRSEPDPAELGSHCRRSLAGYKIPKSWSFAPDLPRNATGKVLKAQLRAEQATRHTEVEA